MDETSIDILIYKIVNEKLHDFIDTDFISNLFDIIEQNKPIPIEYYTHHLIELSKTLEKKCDNITCKRKALYIDDLKNTYCWIHCQN